MNKIKWLLLSISLLTYTLHASDKIYIQEGSFRCDDNHYYIHEEDNTWIESNSLNRDITGYYIHPHNISTSTSGQVQKKWKCPYCYRYWPMGTACQNPDCPSKYKR